MNYGHRLSKLLYKIASQLDTELVSAADSSTWIKSTMQVLVTLVVLTVSINILLFQTDGEGSLREWASGLIGVIVTYWLAPDP